MSVFNGEKFLAEAIESLLDQRFRDFEVILIDDGSTDKTAAILESYRQRDSRVHCYHQQNRGLIASLNRACGLTTGKYIARLDADDIATVDRLALQVEFMEANPKVGVVGGAAEVMDEAGKAINIVRYPAANDDIQRALLHTNVLWHPSVLMRKSSFMAAGAYRKVVHAEDYDLWLRMAECSELANLQEVVLRYRVHPAQISVERCREQALGAGAAQAAARLRRQGRPDPLDSVGEITSSVLMSLGVGKALQQTTLARGYLSCIRNLCSAGEYSLAFTALSKVQSTDCELAEKWVLAEAHLWAAKLYWQRAEYAKAVHSVVRALLTRPLLVGRPVKSLLHWGFSLRAAKARLARNSDPIAG